MPVACLPPHTAEARSIARAAQPSARTPSGMISAFIAYATPARPPKMPAASGVTMSLVTHVRQPGQTACQTFRASDALFCRVEKAFADGAARRALRGFVHGLF